MSEYLAHHWRNLRSSRVRSLARGVCRDAGREFLCEAGARYILPGEARIRSISFTNFSASLKASVASCFVQLPLATR